MVKRMKVSDGDVFTLPIGDKNAIGQVSDLGSGSTGAWFAIYKPLFEGEPTPEQIQETLTQQPIIFAQSVLTFFKLGRWHLLGNCPLRGALP